MGCWRKTHYFHFLRLFYKTASGLQLCCWLMHGMSHPLGRKPNKYYFMSSGINWKRCMTRTQRIFFYGTKNHKREKHCHCVIVYHFVSSYFTLRKLWKSFILFFFPPQTHVAVTSLWLYVWDSLHGMFGTSHFFVISYKLTDVSCLRSVTAFLVCKKETKNVSDPFLSHL